MTIDKEHLEFHAVDLGSGWETPPGYPAGIQQKILAGSLDEAAKKGNRTRLLRFAPGVYTTKPFVHDYWEEVYQLSGDLTVGNDENGEGGESFAPNTYACRPPGAYHGPFKSEGGCLLLETHYYDETN
ncbi:MAG: cupin domain-containing protein [Rhodobiaceae bacterium]|mgnify:CR=1 FL=1|nr:cupin domain-containing protein [Rhodobiaceae bacterium]MCC0052096.1 cupin domain-containing protein [Rhodobiaceae bacterium]MCC0061383.1 cupin domain-containing protein [Rhodobiaceae bacterium]